MILFFRILLTLVLLVLINNSACFARLAPLPNPMLQAKNIITADSASLKFIPIAITMTRPLGEQSSGDYRIRLLTQPAKGWYQPTEGKLTWTPSEANTNAHIEVFLLNALDKKFLPNAGVTLSIFDSNSKLIETKPMIMLWSPDGYHYGNNFTIATPGNYIVKVDITPPMFARHNKQLGNKFFSQTSVTFQKVNLRPEGRVSD